MSFHPPFKRRAMCVGGGSLIADMVVGVRLQIRGGRLVVGQRGGSGVWVDERQKKVDGETIKCQREDGQRVVSSDGDKEEGKERRRSFRKDDDVTYVDVHIKYTIVCV